MINAEIIIARIKFRTIRLSFTVSNTTKYNATYSAVLRVNAIMLISGCVDQNTDKRLIKKNVSMGAFKPVGGSLKRSPAINNFLYTQSPIAIMAHISIMDLENGSENINIYRDHSEIFFIPFSCPYSPS